MKDTGVKKIKKEENKRSNFKFIIVILIFVFLIIGIIFLGKYINNRKIEKNYLENIHEDVDLNSKENSYYELLLKAMNDHKDLVTGVENVYFNLYDLPGLEYNEKQNVAKKVLYSFEIHKDKELLIDTFDGLLFRGILNQETSELKDGIYVTFEDLEKESKSKEKQFAISIYKNSNLNPKLTYNVKLDEDNKIISYEKISDLMPHENTEKNIE